MGPAEPVTVALDEVCACGCESMSATSNSGRLIYSSSDDLPFFSTSAVQRTGRGMQVPLREVEIASGFFQIVMA